MKPDSRNTAKNILNHCYFRIKIRLEIYPLTKIEHQKQFKIINLLFLMLISNSTVNLKESLKLLAFK
jgi:hypothetical protein